MYGSDQAASIEPRGLRQLVGAIRKIEKAMGDGIKQVLDDEIPISEKLRAHIRWESNRWLAYRRLVILYKVIFGTMHDYIIL